LGMSVERNEIEEFLYLEARLMDEHRFDEWLSLWALEDATYWIPAITTILTRRAASRLSMTAAGSCAAESNGSKKRFG
jgi:3-phenylpropionate/cinnamic acid dioxygenase small subunit